MNECWKSEWLGNDIEEQGSSKIDANLGGVFGGVSEVGSWKAVEKEIWNNQ